MSFSYENIPYGALDEAVQEQFSQYAMKEKSSEYNFVCPFCGDLNRPNKKKAYIYKDTWRFKCYRCGYSKHVMQYFKENDDATYSRLLFMGFDNNRERPDKDNNDKAKPNIILPFEDGELVSILDNVPLARDAIELCKKRLIRQEVYEHWFVCLEGEQFLKRDSGGAYIYDENGRPLGNKYKNRIIIPFYKFGGMWNQFDARAIDPQNPNRYMNFEGVKREAYNIDFVDFTKPFYILEGTVDSTFVKNSIAIGGVNHLQEVLADNPDIERHKENCTIIWDNDDPGRSARVDTVRKGFRWFDWSGIKSKDINAAVMSGEMPLVSSGYVNPDFIEARSCKPEGAEILFSLNYGDIKKRERSARKANQELLRAKFSAKRNLGIYF